jgi:serine/threonine-protein kinase RsbW
VTESEQPLVSGAVDVRVPAQVVFVATLRLVAASLAARCELTVDEIEDLRLAVDEACALLLPLATEQSSLDAHFDLEPGRLTVTAVVHTDRPDADFDRTGFAWTVLTALASDVIVDTAPQRATITVVKRREAAAR